MSSAHAVRLAVAGDFWVNRSLPRGDATLETVLDRLRQAEIAVCVLEMPLSGRGAVAEKIVCMRADPHRVDDLERLGIDLVTIANNHMLDYGYEALFDTLDLLELRGIPYVGAGREISQAARPLIRHCSGLKIAFIGFAATLPLGSAAGIGRPGVNPLHVFNGWVIEPSARTQEQPGTPPPIITFAAPEDLRELQKSVSDAKRAADIVVVLPHWGVPNVPQLMDYQRDVAHALVASGADLIVGHHAHCIQPVEVIDGVPIVYGVGNFLFHELPQGMSRNVYDFMSPDGIVVEARLGPGGVEALSLVPLMLNTAGHPSLAGADDAERIASHLTEFSTPYGTRLKFTGERCVVGLERNAA